MKYYYRTFGCFSESFFGKDRKGELLMKKETLQSLKERRSIREYCPEQIKEEELTAVLEAGIYAPTGMGKQSPKIVVVQDRSTVKKLSEMNRIIMGVDFDPFYGAPTVIVVFADSRIPTYVEDGSLVMGNLLLGAYAAGLGSCWIHRAKQMFETKEGKELMRLWGVSETYVGVGNCILGYAKGEIPQAKERKAGYIVRV